MNDVFVSYARKDEPFVGNLATALEQEPYGLTVWRDTEDIYATTLWLEQIKAAITASSTFVVVLTANYLLSDACARELGIALENGKVIAPLLCETSLTPPARIAAVQWVPSHDGTRFAESVKKLVEAITVNADERSEHARLLVRATEWKASGLADSLLRGAELERAEQSLSNWEGRINSAAPDVLRVVPAQRDFVAASRDAARRTRRNGVIGACVIAIALAIAGIVAWQKGVEAKERERHQHAIELASNAARADDIELGLLLAAESLLEWPNSQADAFVRSQLVLVPSQMATVKLANDATSAVFGPDDSRLYLVPADQKLEATAETWVWRSGERKPFSKNAMRVVAAAKGAMVAVIRSDHRVDIIDGATGSPVRTLDHPKNVTSAAFSLNGRYVATGSWDKVVRIWELSSDTGPIAELSRAGVINDVVFLGPKRVAIISAAPDFTLWSWESKHPPIEQRLASVAVLLACSRVNHVAAVAGEGGEVYIYERGFRKYDSGIAKPTAIAVTADAHDTQIAVGGEDGIVTIRNRQRDLTTLKHSAAPIKSIEFSNDGERVLISAGHSAYVWDSSERLILKLAQPGVAFARFSNDNRSILTAGVNGIVRLWSDHPRFQPRTISMAGRIDRLQYFSNGDLATIIQDPKVRFYADESAVITGQRTSRTHKLPAHQAVAIDAHDRRIAMAHLHDVTLFDAQLQPTGTIRFPFDVKELAFSNDGLRIGGAGDDQNAAIHDLSTHRTVACEPLSASASSIVFPGPNTMAIGEHEHVTVYDAKCRRKYSIEDRFAAMKIAATRDGKKLAIAGGDSTTRIRTSRLRLSAELPHGGLVRDLAFNADGTRLVTASDDGFVRIWDTDEAREVARLPRSGDQHAVALSPDDRWLAFARTSNTIEVWPWRPTDLRAEICRSVSRPFTPEESQRYFGSAERNPCPR